MRGPAGERVAGREYSPQELAARLNRQVEILNANEGGITFSGGEPLLQAEFVRQVIGLLDTTHILLDTSGYASEESFRSVARACDLVFFDLKLIDAAAHRQFTGCDNEPILNNLHVLSTLGIPFVVRVPLIPGVTDTDENQTAIAETVHGLPGLVRVDLLPYNRAAGAKYQAANMQFRPGYDETQPVNVNRLPYERAGIPVRVR